MTKPFYTDELVTLHHGRALEVMEAMPSESVDIVVTSPPYNMGLTPGGNGRGMYRHPNQKAGRFDAGYSEHGDDALPWDEYAALRSAELWEMWRIARHGVFYNHRPRVIHGVLMDPLDMLTAHGGGLPPVRQRIVLARPTGIDVGLDHFCTRGEYLYLFAKESFSLASHAASGMGDVWITPIAQHPRHPAPFSASVPGRCITATGARSVLDPFVGSGTTLAVAKGHGIVGIGIELNLDHCADAAARLGSLTHMAGEGTLFGGAA